MISNIAKATSNGSPCGMAANQTVEHTGHCLCGRTRYRATVDPAWTCYCHCESCRRATGVPVTAYAGFPVGRFAFEGEAPARYASSPGVTRTFCRHCGTPLTYQTAEWPDEIHLLLGSLDNPAASALMPGRHVFDQERIPWVDIGGRLPRYPALPGAGHPSGDGNPGAPPGPRPDPGEAG